MLIQDRLPAPAAISVVLGRGNNSAVNFVSVTDVAAPVERAVTDPANPRPHRSRSAASANLTFNQPSPRRSRHPPGGTTAPHHVPWPVLRLVALARLAASSFRDRPSGARRRSGDMAHQRDFAWHDADAPASGPSWPSLHATPLSSCLPS